MPAAGTEVDKVPTVGTKMSSNVTSRGLITSKGRSACPMKTPQYLAYLCPPILENKFKANYQLK